MLGPDTIALTDPDTLAALRCALRTAGRSAALERLGDPEPQPAEPVDLAGRWVRWFELGRVAPYEGSNVAPSTGGITPRLADVAGFYRAFNMAVTGERPDHVVAQLEFLAVTLLAEAEAREADDPGQAEIAARATRLFLRDHIGGWIDAWASRVAAVDALAPWSPAAAAAAELVRAEARDRNVIPLHHDAVLPADAGIAADDEALTGCGDPIPDSAAG